MDDKLQFLAQHGYSVLFLWVLAEQAGLPIPALPVILAAGALTAGGMNLPLALAISVVACLIPDLAWYQLGRRKGMKVLNLLCRISFEPDTCVRKTEASFARQGPRSLLFAKYIPGLSTAAPPLAGVFGMPLRRFITFDALGALIWTGSLLIVGRLFSHQIGYLTERFEHYGGSLTEIIAAGLAVYIAWKFIHRQLFLRRLRIARIQPEELKKMMDEGNGPVVVDLRHPLDFEGDPIQVAGALRMSPDEIEHRHGELPRDRDIILYCT